MSEKPQETREDDLLEQIFTQGLEKITAPAPAAAAEPPPEAEHSGSGPERDGALSPAPRENRGAAVTHLLLILFGAVFLIMLLAFFVQRRSHETALRDLQDSMDLSRAELLEQISALEARISAQRGELSNVYAERAQWQRLYEEALWTQTAFIEQYEAAQAELRSWEIFWELEQHYQSEDHEGCAALLILKDQHPYVYRTPDTAWERYDEIVQAVIDAGYLREDFQQNPKDYWGLVDSYLSRTFPPVTDEAVSRETSRGPQ